jgi:hypothetical protein
MLRNTRQRRLMIRGRIDRKHPIRARRQPGRNTSAERPIRIKRIIQPLEKREFRRVKRTRIVQPVQLLNHQMRMSNQHPVRIDLRRRRVVVRLGVGECTGLQVLELEFGGEGLVGRDFAKVEGEDEFGGGDLVFGED